MEVSLFSEAFQEFRHLLVKDEIVVVSGPLRYDDFIGAWSLNVKNGVAHRPDDRKPRQEHAVATGPERAGQSNC